MIKPIDILFVILIIPIIVIIYPAEEYRIIFVEEDESFSYNFTYKNREEFEYKLLKEIYIYPDDIKDNSVSYEDFYSYLPDNDRWSCMTDGSNFENDLTSGYGIQFIYDNERYIVMDLDSKHSIFNSGLMKGDYIDSIEFESDIMVISSNERGLDNYRIELETYHPDIIEKSKIINHQNQNIGYLAFNSFNSESEEDLIDIFTEFQDRQIDELILDLRLNSGGDLTIVNLLLDILIGQYHKNKVAYSMKFNKKYRAYNEDFIIQDSGYRLNLDRIFFLTSRNTLSASEVLIKSLEPYIEVILVGNMTGGKSMGMIPFYFEETVYLPLSFLIENAEGFSNWNHGLRVDHYINDKYLYPYGDIDDPVIKKVLQLID